MSGAGDLDQRVTFRRQATTGDGMGGNVLAWTDIATVWAQVRPMSGREREHSDRLSAPANYVIKIRDGVRSQYGITEADKAVWQGRDLNLRFVPIQPRAAFCEILAELGVPV